MNILIDCNLTSRTTCVNSLDIYVKELMILEMIAPSYDDV